MLNGILAELCRLNRTGRFTAATPRFKPNAITKQHLFVDIYVSSCWFLHSCLSCMYSEMKHDYYPVFHVTECSENKGMKEIKGLDDRLSSLQQRLLVAQQLVQEQADMAQVGFFVP